MSATAAASAGPAGAAGGPARILITGAAGCVGQYTADHLYRNSNAHLLLLLRDPSKLKAVPANDPRITLLVGDLRDLDPHADAIASATRVIHTATAWGDPERAQQVNVVAVKRLLALLDPARIEQVIYFSTASILDRNLKLLPEAMACGTPVIAMQGGGPAETVVHESTGYLCAQANKTTIAEAISWLIAHEPHYAHLSHACVERAQMFTWEAATSSLEAIFTNLPLGYQTNGQVED